MIFVTVLVYFDAVLLPTVYLVYHLCIILVTLLLLGRSVGIWEICIQLRGLCLATLQFLNPDTWPFLGTGIGLSKILEG